MAESIWDRPIRQVTPRQAFRLFSGSETMNLPCMYASRGPSGNQVITVVGRDFDREFPAAQFEDAVAFYRMVLEELGYL